MRKVIVISGILMLMAAAVFVGLKYIPLKNFSLKKEKPVIQTFSTKQNPAFKAVPQKSPLIVEIKNQEGFFNAIKGDNPIFAELRGIKEFDHLFSDINRFRNFTEIHSGIEELLKNKSIIISVNPTGKNQLTNLFLVQLNNQSESGSAAEIVSRELGPGYTITRRNYEGTTIFGAKSADMAFFFTCTDDIFMISEDFILIEEAIRHSNSQNLLNNHEFTEVYKTIEETALINIFINHQTIHQILARLVSPEIRKNIRQIASYSNWSGLDLTANATNLKLDGYSFTRDSSDNFLNIFKNQEAQKLTIEKAIPSNASYFVAMNLKNTGSFLDHYETYIKANGNFYPREMSLIEFKKKTNTDAVKLIKDLGGNQFAGVFTNINKSNPKLNRFFVAELNNQADAKERLEKAVSDYCQESRISSGQIHTRYETDKKKSFDIYQFPFGNMAESLFGRTFSGIEGEYFALIDKYIIWGDNLPGLKNYLQNLASAQTLANDSIYKIYTRGGQPNPNFYLYAKVPKVFRLKDLLLKPETSALITENEDIIRKFSTFSWQFSAANSMIKNQINLRYEPNIKEEPQAVWQLKLEGQLAQKPKLVLNHKDLPNREVIVRDKMNNVSLINKEGLVLWTINIPGDIVSEIHQIDLYRNNKFQYIFNTKSQLYIIDRMGNKVGKFPVTLKSMASNGVSIAEYGQNKEYRFFIAGEDNQVYVFDRDGKLIPKWNFGGAESLISQPIQHHDIDGKDYLVFTDKRNTYFLDRQGKSREIQSAPFDRSNNRMYFINDGNPRLISTDISGKIHIQDFTGQSEIKEVGKFSAAHRFVVGDLDGDGIPEYLFADGKKLLAFASDGKRLFERSFPDAITETPEVFSLTKGDVKIGIVIGAENKLYLVERNGSIAKGFPLEGDSSFALGKFNDSNAWFNLIAGGMGNTLMNYRIE